MYQLKDSLSHIKYISNKYCSCQLALVMLSWPLENTGNWENTIQLLLDTNIRGLREDEDASSLEGCCQLSWIWLS
ncbi:hypothetical protein BDN71DRAFT_1510418 [Pleurotus eryngii]|uniref:Uncharacterized protein n=1 Tax=Pleurotus eryngii TaxID=5323 RepID=A0A9P6DD36_PLEER|nr:hypothetical protein BDN71DRAFT_1510418 [Pleurotus eryngii]